jgi:hypothetical protein
VALLLLSYMSLLRNVSRRRFSVCFLAFLATTDVGCNRPIEHIPTFHKNLVPYGFLTEAGQDFGTFANVNFLSDDLVLVVVSNNFNYAVEQASDNDQPASKFLLFDIPQNALLRSAEIPIEKHSDSVRATRDEQFIVLAKSGVRLCSKELRCGPSVPTRGPLWVSPRGTRVAAGGNGQTQQILLDAHSLSVLETFTDFSVIPGDVGLLVKRNQRLFIRLPQAQDKDLPFAMEGFGQVTMFLSDQMLSGVASDSAIAIGTFDGNILYHLDARPWWDGTSLARSSSGLRFCLHESGYTRWNDIIHFYDIEKSRRRDFERVRIFDTPTGVERFDLTWDPRPYLGTLGIPALSPNGKRLAIIRRGVLEVFDIR